jgi:hypothetical protein
MVVLGDEEQRAVVALLPPEPPRVDHADPVLLDLLGRGRRHDQHRDLRALARLEGAELLLERGALRGHQRAGPIGDACGEGGDRLERLGVRGRREQREGQREGCQRPSENRTRPHCSAELRGQLS